MFCHTYLVDFSKFNVPMKTMWNFEKSYSSNMAKNEEMCGLTDLQASTQLSLDFGWYRKSEYITTNIFTFTNISCFFLSVIFVFVMIYKTERLIEKSPADESSNQRVWLRKPKSSGNVTEELGYVSLPKTSVTFPKISYQRCWLTKPSLTVRCTWLSP